MKKEVTYHGMMEHFARQARKKLKIICNNLEIMIAIESNVKII
jgi:16S rRNA C1402 (ribose-2'-O) methylase RsmI